MPERTEGSAAKDRRPAHMLDPIELVARIRARAARIDDRLTSTHSNSARALARDAVALADLYDAAIREILSRG